VDVEAIDVRSDFLSRHYQEFAVIAECRIERRDVGNPVVVGEEEKIVAILLIPARYIFGRRIAIAYIAVRMGLPFEPLRMSWQD